jgi:predicted transcriptional regulator
MPPKAKILTDSELEIMRVVWELNQGTVRQVYEILRQRKQTAYTTVMTMMNILEEKGHLKKTKEGKAFVYEPLRPENQVVSQLLNDFLTRVFDGSARPLLVRLIKENLLSEEDLEEIERLIKERK